MKKTMKGVVVRSKHVDVPKGILDNRKFDDIDVESMVNFKYDLDYKLEDLKCVTEGSILLSKHIEKNNHIAVVTDYDCDGITSAVTLTKGLLDVFACDEKQVTTIINRKKNGNGFNKSLVAQILDLHKRKPIDLIVAADHGSANNAEYGIFKEHGIETLITDHHSIEHGIPHNATVFINPQREDSTYIKSISGCCVAFLLLVKTYKGMFKTNNFSSLHPLLPYVGISTITDIMSLDEPFNRHLVRLGLRVINSHKDRMWGVIKKAIGVPGLLTVKDIGFKFGPVVNAGNCTDTEQNVFAMLMSKTIPEIEGYMKGCISMNKLRKDTTNQIVKNLNTKDVVTNDTSAIVLLIETHLHINGKVAPGVGIKYNKPVVCFNKIVSEGVEYYSGSGRGIVKGYNILEVFNAINREDPSIFKRFGGHAAAIGCTVNMDKLEEFKVLFNKHTKISLDKLGVVNDLIVDMYIPDYMINTKLAQTVTKYEPYGKNWSEPIFISNLMVDRTIKMGTITKFVFYCPTNGNKVSGIYFYGDDGDYTSENIHELRGQMVQVAYKIKVNTFRGKYDLDLEVAKIGLVE